MAVQWSSLQSAYGSAQDVGKWLIDLTSLDWDTAFNASHMLWCSLCHQHAFISPAAVPALPFLFEVGKAATEGLLVELLDIFCGFAICSEPPGHGNPPGEWVATLRAELKLEAGWFRELRSLPNPDGAAFAATIVECLEATPSIDAPPV
jgi:hypothetical protein